MNERLMRAAPGRFAEFVTAFEEAAPEPKSKSKSKFKNTPNLLWLVWKFEGDWTLWNLMQKRDFPYNLEPLLLGQEVDLPKGPQRSILTIRLVMLEVRFKGCNCKFICFPVVAVSFGMPNCQAKFYKCARLAYACMQSCCRSNPLLMSKASS